MNLTLSSNFIIKDQILDNIVPISFNGTTLIPIKVNLEKLFKTNQIQFKISIKDKKIIIESPEILADLDIQDNRPEKGILNVN